MAEEKAAEGKKPIFKKWWFWVIVVILVLGMGGSMSGGNSNTSNNVGGGSATQQAAKTVDKTTLQSVYDQYLKYDPETLAKYTTESQSALSDALAAAKTVLDNESASADEIKAAYDGIMTAVKNLKEPEVSTEFKNALKKAQSYSDTMHMSKARIYDQLTSSYGEGFPADAAEYAIEHVKADWKENALKTGKTYYEKMSMSKSAVYDQLVSQYGEKFTSEEAQYAVDNL